jgi:hypothetical protein
MAGLYEIIRQVRHSYEVKLPNFIKIHPIFLVDRLRKATDDPLPRQRNEPSPPIKVTDNKEWEVKEVIAIRKTRKTLYYKAKWVRYDNDLE